MSSQEHGERTYVVRVFSSKVYTILDYISEKAIGDGTTRADFYNDIFQASFNDIRSSFFALQNMPN